MEQEREAFEAWRTEYYRTHTLPEPDSGDWAWAGWQARAAIAAQQAAQPVAWVRFCSDGTYEGPLMDWQIEEVRKRSGAWTPLYAAEQPKQASKIPQEGAQCSP